jgi:hypothetical protein
MHLAAIAKFLQTMTLTNSEKRICVCKSRVCRLPSLLVTGARKSGSLLFSSICYLMCNQSWKNARIDRRRALCDAIDIQLSSSYLVFLSLPIKTRALASAGLLYALVKSLIL